jgi:hypothetical protein
VTCIFPLLFSEGREGPVLQPPYLELQQLEVHRRLAAVVVAFGRVYVRARDPEDRDPAAVRATQLDTDELTAAGEREATQEKVVGLKHVSPPCPVEAPSPSSHEQGSLHRALWYGPRETRRDQCAHRAAPTAAWVEEERWVR